MAGAGQLARHAKKDRVDLFHSPCLTAPLMLNCPLVVTVHDMIWAFPGKSSRSRSLSLKRRLMGAYIRMIRCIHQDCERRLLPFHMRHAKASWNI